MSVEDMPDGRLVHYYESVRKQVEADIAGNHTFMMNPTTQQYADQLQSEMIKRGLEHSPIPWPPEMACKYRKVVDEDGQQVSKPEATGHSSMIGVQTHEEIRDIQNPAERNDRLKGRHAPRAIGCGHGRVFQGHRGSCRSVWDTISRLLSARSSATRRSFPSPRCPRHCRISSCWRSSAS